MANVSQYKCMLASTEGRRRRKWRLLTRRSQMARATDTDAWLPRKEDNLKRHKPRAFHCGWTVSRVSSLFMTPRAYFYQIKGISTISLPFYCPFTCPMDGDNVVATSLPCSFYLALFCERWYTSFDNSSQERYLTATLSFFLCCFYYCFSQQLNSFTFCSVYVNKLNCRLSIDFKVVSLHIHILMISLWKSSLCSFSLPVVLSF